MKEFRRVGLVAVFAVILALAALCFTACGGGGGKTDGSKTRYTLTFMFGTTVYDTVTAEAGSDYSLNKGDPYKVNYVFDGWSSTANGAVEELPDKMPSENRTYHAVFSMRFNLTLNAGIGSIPSDKRTFTVKEGDDLYALVSQVTPTISDGDATFAGWFLRGRDTDKITETSGQKMPGINVEAVAKYSVNYTVNIYKEVGFHTDEAEYAAEPDDVVNKTAYVGEPVSGLPAYEGFYYDENKDNDVLHTNLGKNSAQNAFSLYYKLRGYSVAFNAHLSDDADYSGTMATITRGHGLKFETPECGFTAGGYRFIGWSVTTDGDVEYRPGDDISVKNNTTLYAQWVRGLTEISGISSDRVYIMNKLDEPQTVVAYLERTGLSDILGEYNATTHVFTFKNAGGSNPDYVVLRGIADRAHNTFTYLNTNNATVYTLQKINGDVDSSVTLTLSDDGKAVYNDGTDTTNGSYIGGNDGSMLFVVDGKTEFAFRLVYSSENSITSFMIRGDEYGTWNNITQAGVVDTSFTLSLDGYGVATMVVTGLSNNLQDTVIAAFGGLYVYTTGNGAYEGDAGKEIAVTLYNSSFNIRRFACLLMTGTYHSGSSGDTKVYTNVYLQRFETTLYGAPADDEEFDIETADRIELSGYGVTDDSATYTYTDNDGKHTVNGKYYYDSVAGTLRIIRADTGNDLLFEVSVFGEGESAVPVFEPVEELFDHYFILGFESTYGPRGMYQLYIYNNNCAAFSFMLPMSDSFYGDIALQYARVIYGEYTLAEEGETETGGADPHANIYEYNAEISTQTYNIIYSMYGINANLFGKFRFKFVYSEQTNNISHISVTAIGDLQDGKAIVYNDVEYTLNGFGVAESESGNIKYTYDSNMLDIVPDESEPNATVRFVDWNGGYVERVGGYSSANCSYSFYMSILKDGKVILSLGSASPLYAFSVGAITWEDEDHTYGTYVRDYSVEFSDIYDGVNRVIKDFKFTFGTVKNDDGVDVPVIYIYDVNASVSEDGEIVIINENQDELTLNRADGTATYTKKDGDDENDTEYNGKFIYVGDTVQFAYTEQSVSKALTFKLEYGAEGGITGFHVVSNEAAYGYVLDMADGRSYLYLSGEQTSEDGVYTGVYAKYDADSDEFTAYNGTYCLTKKANVEGYDFTYETGEFDTNGNNVTETFTFRIRSNSGIMLFQKYVMNLGLYVYYMSASCEQPMLAGLLTGGEYSAQILVLLQTQTQYQGNLEWNDEAEVWVFTTDNGATFYFNMLSNIEMLMLDSTYVAETKGMFELSESVEVDIPATEATLEASAVPAHTAVATRIEMTGMSIAYLHYDYNGTDKVISGIYVQDATGSYEFIMTGNPEMMLRFRLVKYIDDYTGEVTYQAVLADMDFYGSFVGDDFTVINLNGFTTACYVDSYGRVYAGVFEVVTKEGTTALVRVRYIDLFNYTDNIVYASLDLENRTFVIVTNPSEEGN